MFWIEDINNCLLMISLTILAIIVPISTPTSKGDYIKRKIKNATIVSNRRILNHFNSTYIY